MEYGSLKGPECGLLEFSFLAISQLYTNPLEKLLEGLFQHPITETEKRLGEMLGATLEKDGDQPERS